MSNPAAQIQNDAHTSGFFNYLDEFAEPSLYRNGKVLLHRDPDGSDSGFQGIDRAKYGMIVSNGRNLLSDQRRTVTTNGFELLTRPLAQAGLDFFDHQQVVRDYYRQCVDIVEEATGARAFAFDHNVRSAQGKKNQKRISGGQQVQGPAHIVHGDYTLTSAPQRLRDLANPPGGNDTLRAVLAPDTSLISEEMVERSLADGGRFAIINVWRNIDSEPVATHPIALCDGQTVVPEDLVVFELHYQDRIGENYFAKHADRHRWYYFPEMTGDEALLIKQWDSAGPLARSKGRLGDASDLDAPCTFSFHSAFEDPATPPDAPDRWSIEVRCIVIYN
ncbi:MAG: hypothetical protein HQ511_13470 [Rhodospirillales bacterium]|nr:hypothetical protein [Rhodospirillales bacterium]